MLMSCAVSVEVDQQLPQMKSKSIGMPQNTTNVVTTQMTLDMKSSAKKVLPAKTIKMEKAIMSPFASLIQQILVMISTLPQLLVKTVDTQMITHTGSNVQKV